MLECYVVSVNIIKSLKILARRSLLNDFANIYR